MGKAVQLDIFIWPVHESAAARTGSHAALDETMQQLGMHWRAAGYVDRIPKDAKPADLPIEQPTRFSRVVISASRAGSA